MLQPKFISCPKPTIVTEHLAIFQFGLLDGCFHPVVLPHLFISTFLLSFFHDRFRFYLPISFLIIALCLMLKTYICHIIFSLQSDSTPKSCLHDWKRANLIYITCSTSHSTRFNRLLGWTGYLSHIWTLHVNSNKTLYDITC